MKSCFHTVSSSQHSTNSRTLRQDSRRSTLAYTGHGGQAHLGSMQHRYSRQGRQHLCTTASSSSLAVAGSGGSRGVTSSLKVSGPPASFDFREATDSTTRELVAARYPELLDLVQEGTLVAVPRPADYHERRTDGYQEPELVFVVGTAHVSTKSAEDVRRVITAVEPDNVVVELCRSRAAIMYDDAQDAQDAGSQGRAAGDGNSTASTSGRSGAQAINPMSLSGGSLPQAFQRTLQLGGSPALMLRLALGQLSKRLSARVGVRTGEDVRAARQAAEAVGAELVLGDRPIEITLERAWNALSWRRKAQLAWALFQGVTRAEHERIDQDLVEALKADDVISATFADISEQYPEVVSPLVHERDLYLAWSLKRSKAVNGKRCVVGVVGRGHLRGIVFALMHSPNGNLRFRDLVNARNVRRSQGQQRRDLARLLAKEAAVAGGLYVAWRAFTVWQGVT